MLRVIFNFFIFWFRIGLLLTIVGCAVVGYLFYTYSKDLPDYSQLANYHPPGVTRIYSRDGKLIEEYAQEHRIFIPISNIPKSLIEAFIAAEDKNYYNHPGVDLVSIARAALNNFTNPNRRMQGGSTITQQVVKQFLLTSERSIERKIKEAVLSYMISETFTKDQILELYLNQIFLGKNSYGVASAAQNYFNKSVDELNVAESAFLAALPKAPSNFNPLKNYAKAKSRRDYVLLRMVEDGFINTETARESIDSPITLLRRDKLDTVSADYYAERVRDEVISMIGKENFYKDGLTIITSLDTNIQNSARNSLRKGIREYDLRKGFRGPIANINDIDNWQANLLKVQVPASLLEYDLAVVLEVNDNQAKIGLRDGTASKILLAEMKWGKTDLKSAKNLLKKGNVIVVEPAKNGYALRQIPEVNGAIMVMNPTSGQVLATQGGYDFSQSKFDRATQAMRQPGSLSKTFVYLAALENGVQPNTIFEDGPITVSQGKGMPLWKPKNYGSNFLGKITMRKGLEKSRNLITVRVAQTVGLSKIAEIIKRFNINNNPKKVYSMVLGALETTLERMTTAYATIANEGHKSIPHFIELIKDRNGKVIYRRSSAICIGCNVSDEELADAPIPELSNEDSRLITDEASSYQITSMLTGAVERGTGVRARKIGKIIAGKSGTTNESKDTWYVGFTPRIIVGTYVGYDNPRTLGKTATGSNVALPIFIDFMQEAYKDVPSLPFNVPDTIKLVTIDQNTGMPALGVGGIVEAFKNNELAVQDLKTKEVIDDMYNSNNDILPEKHDPFHQIHAIDQSEEVY